MCHQHSDLSLQPAPFLVENIGLLPVGKALDVAMGSGRNAVYLAQNGFDVEGIDISTGAVKAAQELAKANHVIVNAYVADLEETYHIKQNTYDVVICFNYLQRSLIPQIREALKPGGMVVYETFIVDQPRLFGKPRNPEYLLKYNELLEVFRNFRCLRYREGIIGNKAALASIVAQKPTGIEL